MVRVSDVPGIVRAEVAQALEEAMYLLDSRAGPRWKKLYLAARFPEPPEGKELDTCTHPDCGIVTPHAHGKDKGVRVVARPAPSAETATPEPKNKETFRQTFDARDWAREFVQTLRKHPNIAADESTMLGWFANALMRGYDEGWERCLRRDVDPPPPPSGIVETGPSPSMDGISCTAAPAWHPNLPCTACPCARCQSERSFLEALAHAEVACDGIEIDVPVTTNQAFRGAIAAAKALLRVTEGR